MPLNRSLVLIAVVVAVMMASAFLVDASEVVALPPITTSTWSNTNLPTGGGDGPSATDLVVKNGIAYTLIASETLAQGNFIAAVNTTSGATLWYYAGTGDWKRIDVDASGSVVMVTRRSAVFGFSTMTGQPLWNVTFTDGNANFLSQPSSAPPQWDPADDTKMIVFAFTTINSTWWGGFWSIDVLNGTFTVPFNAYTNHQVANTSGTFFIQNPFVLTRLRGSLIAVAADSNDGNKFHIFNLTNSSGRSVNSSHYIQNQITPVLVNESKIVFATGFGYTNATFSFFDLETGTNTGYGNVAEGGQVTNIIPHIENGKIIALGVMTTGSNNGYCTVFSVPLPFKGEVISSQVLPLSFGGVHYDKCLVIGSKDDSIYIATSNHIVAYRFGASNVTWALDSVLTRPSSATALLTSDGSTIALSRDELNANQWSSSSYTVQINTTTGKYTSLMLNPSVYGNVAFMAFDASTRSVLQFARSSSSVVLSATPIGRPLSSPPTTFKNATYYTSARATFLVGDYLFVVDGSTLTCLSATNGTMMWAVRNPQNQFSSSIVPIIAGDWVYTVNDNGYNPGFNAHPLFGGPTQWNMNLKSGCYSFNNAPTILATNSENASDTFVYFNAGGGCVVRYKVVVTPGWPSPTQNVYVETTPVKADDMWDSDRIPVTFFDGAVYSLGQYSVHAQNTSAFTSTDPLYHRYVKFRNGVQHLLLLDGLLALVRDNFEIALHDPRTLKKLSRVSLERCGNSVPFIFNNRIYISDYQGNVTTFGLSSINSSQITTYLDNVPFFSSADGNGEVMPLTTSYGVFVWTTYSCIKAVHSDGRFAWEIRHDENGAPLGQCHQPTMEHLGVVYVTCNSTLLAVDIIRIRVWKTLLTGNSNSNNIPAAIKMPNSTTGYIVTFSNMLAFRSLPEQLYTAAELPPTLSPLNTPVPMEPWTAVPPATAAPPAVTSGPTAVPDYCNQFLNCTSCIAHTGCGWDNETNVCRDGDAVGPAHGSHPLRRNWHYFSCPCGIYDTCSGCVFNERCGWGVDPGFTGSCVSGTSGGPFSGNYTEWFYGNCMQPVTSAPTSAPTGGDTCNQLLNCTSCISSGECGWDNETNTCRAGGPSGPTQGGATSSRNWHYYNCPCSTHTSCAQCIATDGCGWDSSTSNGSCLSGQSGGPFNGRNTGNWSYYSCPCHVHRTCSSCIRGSNCGWGVDAGTTGTCTQGWAAGAYTQNFTEWFWVSCTNPVTVAPASTTLAPSYTYAPTYAPLPPGTTAAPTGGDSCNQLLNCTSCISSGECGWDNETNTCRAGGPSGPTRGAATSSRNWHYYYCPCSTYTSCRDCTAAFEGGLCGWDSSTFNGSCLDGSNTGPSNGKNVSAGNWSFDSCPCHVHHTCSSCIEGSECGWGVDAGTAGTCATGSATGANTHNFTEWFYLNCTGTPSKSTPAPSDPCRTSTNCSSCIRRSGCGWSGNASSGQCLLGNAHGPLGGTTAIDWSYFWCPCNAYDTCSSCFQGSGCGWGVDPGFTGSCVRGTSGGPSSGNYTEWFYGNCMQPVVTTAAPAASSTPAPTTNDPCRTSTNCSSCIRRSGCGWSGNASSGQCLLGNAHGPLDGTTTTDWSYDSCPSVTSAPASTLAPASTSAPPTNTPSSSNCNFSKTCTDCTSQAHCGWNSETNTCLAGTSNGSSVGNTSKSNWHYHTCPCSFQSTCTECISVPFCGWDSSSAKGSCMSGTAAGPLDNRTKISAGNWSYLSCPCHTRKSCGTCLHNMYHCGWGVDGNGTTGTCTQGSASGAYSNANYTQWFYESCSAPWTPTLVPAPATPVPASTSAPPTNAPSSSNTSAPTTTPVPAPTTTPVPLPPPVSHAPAGACSSLTSGPTCVNQTGANCFWCGDAGGCVDTASSCPTCAHYNNQSTCTQNVGSSGACSWCGTFCASSLDHCPATTSPSAATEIPTAGTSSPATATPAFIPSAVVLTVTSYNAEALKTAIITLMGGTMSPSNVQVSRMSTTSSDGNVNVKVQFFASNPATADRNAASLMAMNTVPSARASLGLAPASNMHYAPMQSGTTPTTGSAHAGIIAGAAVGGVVVGAVIVGVLVRVLGKPKRAATDEHREHMLNADTEQLESVMVQPQENV